MKRPFDRPGRAPRIVITTTLKHDTLYHAKLGPLLEAHPTLEVVVVTDREGPHYDRVRWVWPRGALCLLGRLGGRIPLIARAVLHPSTALVMAYNVIPHGLFAMAFGRLRRVPVFLHLISGPAEIRFAHDPAISDNRLVTRSRHPERWERLARRLIAGADRVFAPGSRTKALLVANGIEPDRISVLHSAVDLVRFRPADGARDIDVLVSAQLRERKRPIFTLRVLAMLAAARPDLRFCWLGDGPMQEAFEAAVDELGLRGRLEWTVTDDVESYYRRARVFLLCSVNEGLSLACMEAMASGAVPVTSDCGDMGDVVRSGETGELVPLEADEAQFAERVLPLLDDPERWRAASSAARELIVEEHALEKEVRAWREVLSLVGASQMAH